jgi:hypothetical protein
LKGLDGRLSLKGKGLQRKKPRKTGKTRKKVQNNFRGTPDFLQKRTDFGRWNLQAADYQMLPHFSQQDFHTDTGFQRKKWQTAAEGGPGRNPCSPIR